MKEYKDILDQEMPAQHFEAASFAVLDFQNHKWEAVYSRSPELQHVQYFDLASLTKPLSVGLCFLIHPELWETKQFAWLLNHRACLPIGGRLSKKDWKEHVKRFIPVLSDGDVYSDFSPLRLQLEIQEKLGKHLYEIVSPFWHDQVLSWLDLGEKKKLCPPTGIRRGKTICGDVHDDNAFVIGEKLSHAGLFGTIEGVCETLFKMDKELGLLKEMSTRFEEGEKEGRRFVRGWDTVSDPQTTLAGEGCSEKTFGHLGFTGTSIWIDCERKKGHVLLSNATQSYWYERSGLRELRRRLGHEVWRQK